MSKLNVVVTVSLKDLTIRDEQDWDKLREDVLTGLEDAFGNVDIIDMEVA